VKIQQSQQLSQQLVMTPQLQQAIRLLQLTHADLVVEIEKEFDTNPLLSVEGSGPSAELASLSKGVVRDHPLGEDERFQGSIREAEKLRSEATVERLDDRHRAADGNSAQGEAKAVRDIEWDQYVENRVLQAPAGGGRGGFEELPPIEQNLTRKESLVDHLRWQLKMSDFNEAERAFAEIVLSSLDDNGFLDLKSGYRASIQDLRDFQSKNPTEKNPDFNLGIIYEQMGNFPAATLAWKRYLGSDINENERALAEGLFARVSAAAASVKALVTEIGKTLDEKAAADEYVSRDGLREVLAKLRSGDYDENAVRDGVAFLRELDGKADARIARVLEDELANMASLRVDVPPTEAGLLLSRALMFARNGAFAEAVPCLKRYLGGDLEPHERTRGELVLARARHFAVGAADLQVSPDEEISLEWIAEQSGLNPDDAEEVLKLMQLWDPIGCCARDLRESLMIQAEVYGFEDIEMAVIDRHMSNLEKHNYNAIAKDLKISVEEVYEAVKEIQKLESRPARNFTDYDEKSIAITPDVYVVKDEKTGGWRVQDNDRGVPRLFANKELFEQLATADPAKRAILQEKWKNAQWLVKALEERRKTITRVMESIVARQQEFFENGTSFLRPMILRDIVEDFQERYDRQIHESTISRVTSNKYVHTPHGIFELKHFFNSPIRRQSEEDIASESVKRVIRKIIDDENKKAPLSDQAIVEFLAKDEGIVIARRTVAKYREMMGILPSSKRKKHF
jgi:RNA polymerase sigma-54 factor